MQSSIETPQKKVVSLIIKTVLSMTLLLVAWVVISNLPMFIEIRLPLYFSLLDVISAGLLTVVAILIFKFGTQIRVIYSEIDLSFPQILTIIEQSMFLIFLMIIYFAFRPIVVPYMDYLDWTYHVVFLIFFLFVMGSLGFYIFRNVDALTEQLANKSILSNVERDYISCENCSCKNNANAKFCSNCGFQLRQARRCDSCGATQKANNKFCTDCGKQVSEKTSEADTIEKDLQSEAIIVETMVSGDGELEDGYKNCTFCNEVIKVKAIKCKYCYSELGSE
jgi:hypothetical protein